MLKNIFNDQEKKTHRILRPVCENHGATVYPKVGVADVFRIERSGISDEDYEFCLKAHFDFVAYDQDGNPLFAVEFDGPQHQNDPRQKGRDARKNRLCERFGLPLLRVGDNHVVEREGVAFLEYMIDLHFGEEAVQEGVEAGLFAPDEEYFPGTEFPGITKLCKELHKRSIYAPAWLLLQSEEERKKQLWYRVSDQSLEHPTPPKQGPCKASVKIEILRGWNQPKEILSVKRTAILTDCSPNFGSSGICVRIVEK